MSQLFLSPKHSANDAGSAAGASNGPGAPQHPQAFAGRRIAGLDLVRSIAILWVMLIHTGEIASGAVHGAPSFIRRILDGGTWGVDLFFVLSGTLIGGILLREVEVTGELDVRRFWSRRWLRTLPAYYAVLLIGFALDVPRHRIDSWQGQQWTYLGFLQSYLSTMPRFNWSWSLCIEEHFYLFLPLVVAGAHRLCGAKDIRKTLRWIAVVAIVCSVASRAFHLLQDAPPFEVLQSYQLNTKYYTVYTHCRLDGLALGLLIAAWPARVSQRSAVALLAFFVVGYALTPAWPTSQSMWIGHYLWRSVLVASLVVAFGRCARLEAVRVPGARFVADHAYALYLVHQTVFGATKQLAVPDALRVVLAWSVVFVVAMAVRRFVELPVLRWRDGQGAPPARASEVAPTP